MKEPVKGKEVVKVIQKGRNFINAETGNVSWMAVSTDEKWARAEYVSWLRRHFPQCEAVFVEV